MTEMDASGAAADTEPAQPEALTMFTFQELVLEIQEAERLAKDKESWARLREVVSELSVDSMSAEPVDFVSGHRWSLLNV